MIEEYPLTLECKVIDIQELLGETRIVGEVVNMSVDESILDQDGNINIDAMEPISFDSVSASYRVIGGKVGNAFKDGAQLK